MFESPDNDLPGTVPLLARVMHMHSPGTSNATLMIRAEHRWQPASLPTDASRGRLLGQFLVLFPNLNRNRNRNLNPNLNLLWSILQKKEGLRLRLRLRL